MSLCCAIPFGNSRQTVSKGRSKPRGDPSRPKGGEGTNRCCALSPQHMVFRGPSLPQQVRDLSGASDSRASDFAGAWVPYGAGPFSSHCIPTHLLLPMGPAGRQATPPRGPWTEGSGGPVGAQGVAGRGPPSATAAKSRILSYDCDFLIVGGSDRT